MERCDSCHEPASVLVYCATCIRRCCEPCLFGEDLYCLPCWRNPPPVAAAEEAR